ncbi:MAG: hypothetical protein R6X35_09290 [Candidatus Krumholzibacteriia bacterium]
MPPSPCPHRCLGPAVALLLAAAPAAAAAAADLDPAAGCLYGTVATADGDTLTGFLRTGSWDAFWDDAFTATRAAWPWAEMVDTEELAKERRAEYFREHGLFDRLAYVLEGRDRGPGASRLFLCRYGQIARIALDRGEAEVETTDGGRHRVRRGRDLDGDLTVAAADSQVLDFDDVVSIAFGPAPSGALPPWRRLAGTVTTDDGTLRGFIRWDLSESVDLDVLDGEDGTGDHDLPMGEITSIAKERDGARVVLRDGRSLLLTGTNDVNADNRGVAVELGSRGRVTVPWRRFVRVDFDPPGPAGPGRGAFAPGRELRGTVTDTDGARRGGRLVWDLDEGWTWDLLNGEGGGLTWDIPFAAVASVAPDRDGALVVLRDGTRLRLDGGTDVTAENQGVLLLDGDHSVRVPWRRVALVEFAE